MPHETAIVISGDDLFIEALRQTTNEEGEFEDLPASPWQDYGEVKMNRGDIGFLVEYAGQRLRPDTILITILGRPNYYARRAMFDPGDTTKPLCSTPLVGVGEKERKAWVGKNREEETLLCNDCPDGEFGGACRETRLIWFMIWTEGPDGKLELLAPIPFRMSVPLTSINMTDSIVKRAKLLSAMRNGQKVPVPLIATIWKLSSEVIKKTGFTYSRLTPPEFRCMIPSKAQFGLMTELAHRLFEGLEQFRRENIVPEGADGRIDLLGAMVADNPQSGSDPMIGPDGQPLF